MLLHLLLSHALRLEMHGKTVETSTMRVLLTITTDVHFIVVLLLTPLAFSFHLD